ncbi:aminotransferase-like domain-containing protein [Niallia nealsonii]|uniref:GntR family transcriptional regulator n=1 Tax=Niallia nealsonii TaxID=115979 RepID=A0A2N0Z2L9_9BACI|nr:PLP-dependent aminotransferase family protein [Niallia nealsonii]PKG23755.1 GntR family transcriptional regulator [Niallia nealsonii]
MKKKENWIPNKQSSIPLYQQIYDYIKIKIIRGEWPVGFKLPAQRELAGLFQVNRSTVVYALDELAADGFLLSKVGKGTTVLNNSWSLLSAVPPPDWKAYVEAGTYQPNLPTVQEINKGEFLPGIIRLGTGELSPDLLPSQMVQMTFMQEKAAEISLNYPEPKGEISLRNALSSYLAKRGIQASSSSILVVSGGIQALQLISLGLLPFGSTILHEAPSYLHSIQVFQSAGMKLTGVPMDDRGVLVDAISRLKRQHQAALFYTNPSFHNPTGSTMILERRQELLALAAKERMPIIEDDVYGDLWFDTPPPPTLKELDKGGNVLYVGSMSKVLGPGLRIGFIAGPESVINRLADIKMQTDYGSSTLSQFLVAEWLSNGFYENYIKNLRRELKNRRDFTLNLLNLYMKDLAVWHIPQGGFYIWLSILPTIPMGVLFEKARKKGILLNLGIIYDHYSQRHLRLSYSYARPEQLEEGIIALAQMILSLAK